MVLRMILILHGVTFTLEGSGGQDSILDSLVPDILSFIILDIVSMFAF